MPNRDLDAEAVLARLMNAVESGDLHLAETIVAEYPITDLPHMVVKLAGLLARQESANTSGDQVPREWFLDARANLRKFQSAYLDQRRRASELRQILRGKPRQKPSQQKAKTT